MHDTIELRKIIKFVLTMLFKVNQSLLKRLYPSFSILKLVREVIDTEYEFVPKDGAV